MSGSLAKITPADYDLVRSLATTQEVAERFDVSLSTAHKHRNRAAAEQPPAEPRAQEPASAAPDHRDLQGRVAVSEHRRKLERRRAKRKGLIAPASRAPENGPRASAPSRSRKTGGRILPAFQLDENFGAVGASASGSGVGPAWWLDERDRANARARDPRLQAEERETQIQQALARLGPGWRYDRLANDGRGAYVRDGAAA